MTRKRSSRSVRKNTRRVLAEQRKFKRVRAAALARSTAVLDARAAARDRDD